jgi:hypothetical protein
LRRAGLNNRGLLTTSSSKPPPENISERPRSQIIPKKVIPVELETEDKLDSPVETPVKMKFGPPKGKKKVKTVTPDVTEDEDDQPCELPFSQVKPLAEVS